MTNNMKSLDDLMKTKHEEGNVQMDVQQHEPPSQQEYRYTKQQTNYNQQNQYQRQNQFKESNQMNLFSIANRRVRASIGGLSDAVLQTVKTIFDDAKGETEESTIDRALRRERFNLIPLNSNITGSNPAMLITLDLRPVDNVQNILSYILVFESKGTQTTSTRGHGRDTYEGIDLPEHMLDKRFMHLITQQITDGNMDVPVVVVNAQIISYEVTHQLSLTEGDVDRTRALVTPLINNAIDALSFRRNLMMSLTKDETKIDVSLRPEMVKTGAKFEVHFENPSVQQLDSSGIPQRSDVLAKVKYSQLEDVQYGAENYESVNLGSISAAIDLYLDVEEGYGIGGRFAKNNDNQPFWLPVLEINSVGIDSEIPHSLEYFLYMITQMSVQTNNYRWARSLRPKHINNTIRNSVTNLIDLGWLNYYNPNQEMKGYVEGIGPNVTDNELSNYLSNVVRPEISIGLSIGSSSEKSWLAAIFERIAEHNDMNAMNTLYKACNVLTDGIFTDLANQNQMNVAGFLPVYSTGTRELIGVWTDENGTKRALSEWNVAAVASHVRDTNGAEDLVYEYQTTYTNTSISLDKQLNQRLAILRDHVVGDARVICTAPKLALDPVFLQTLTDAISKTVLNPNTMAGDGLNNSFRSSRTMYGRYTASNIGFKQQNNNSRRGFNNWGYFGNFYS